MSHTLPKKQASQLELYWKAHRKIANENHAFMDAIREGATKKELQAIINRRPSVWGRFQSLVNNLPDNN